MTAFGAQFNENLALLPAAQTEKINIINIQNEIVASLENKPGQAGSLRVYLYLQERFGAITPEAAQLGVKIYAEHTEDAKQHPGKHPNIDRLFDVIEHQHTLRVQA